MFNRQALLDLLILCDTVHDGTLANIVTATQKQWLVSRNEPVPPEGTTYPLEKSNAIRELLDKLRYINEIKPLHKHYDYAILLGGEITTMEPRIAFLLKLYNEGLRFNRLIFHCGLQNIPLENREWTSGYEEIRESDAAKILCKNAALEELFKTPITFVEIPLQKTDHGLRNPNALDGVIAWLALNPKPGKCLIISNQPYILYHNSIFKTALPNTFSFETVGPAIAADISISEMLDYVTRHLYQENETLLY